MYYKLVWAWVVLLSANGGEETGRDANARGRRAGFGGDKVSAGGWGEEGCCNIMYYNGSLMSGWVSQGGGVGWK